MKLPVEKYKVTRKIIRQYLLTTMNVLDSCKINKFILTHNPGLEMIPNLCCSVLSQFITLIVPSIMSSKRDRYVCPATERNL